MTVETLEELKFSFQSWRQKKQYRSQAIPEALLEQARAAVSKHGLAEVVRATGLAWNRISPKKLNNSLRELPSYTRIEMSAPENAGPLAEVESVSGHKLRIFSMGSGINELVSSFCRGSQ